MQEYEILVKNKQKVLTKIIDCAKGKDAIEKLKKKYQKTYEIISVNKIKVYKVSWLETHTVYVKATNEIEARDKTSDNSNYLCDESIELEDGINADEVSEKDLRKLRVSIRILGF